ncbi:MULTISPECIES: ABC transporter substrate-binding protein [unclassified Actinopolyspora]|uniref:ABC transporter substrate-binding protein n=1 Tax=unclassified Actinopolyspora TaxID=2639451 RepID=UPI0013F68737|nr:MULTISPECIES: ABC transporter substrate-binding protein [unclassified Actinopolyspora]NHD17835.1 ABC transporter substrate-binding protein [Actinopolyspora sp. BKK2]NHE77708.1 ABC transporter substrate-binding protein [Actinopolyspora sp. BKK1]
MRGPSRSLSLCCLTLLTAGLLTACGGGSPDSSGRSAPGYPRTVENCGRQVTLDAPPERAVSLDQGSTEILLSLGLADRVAGTATWTDPVLKSLEEANSGVPRLADDTPSYERVLAEEPDFVSASFESTVSRVASREKFAQLGVPTYVAPADCAKNNAGDGDGSRSEQLRMDRIYQEIEDLARMFDVEQRGAELVDELRSRITAATEDIDASGVSVLYWFANKESPYMAGCCGAPGIITDRIGARNVFDDTHQEWPQINWETVAERNPDVLVLGDLTRESQTAEEAEQKIRFLESNPVTKHMDAVRNERYIELSGAAMNPSIRTVNGVERVAAKLREFGLVE